MKYESEADIWLANNPISHPLKALVNQCTLPLIPENIRKPYGFLMFSGSRERVHWFSGVLRGYEMGTLAGNGLM